MINFTNLNTRDIIGNALNNSFKLQPTIGLDKKYTFGIEIEFESAPLDSITDIENWKLIDEVFISKSIDNKVCGGELISPIFVDNEETWIDISNKCKKLNMNGATTSNYTGGHIHIGSQILGEDSNSVKNFLNMWELFENIIYHFAYGYSDKDRLGIGFYANPIGKKIMTTRTSKDGFNKFKNYYHWINYFKQDKFQKRGGVSFKNFKGINAEDGNTIEIRCPNGTLDPIIWQNNINFFTRLLLAASSNNFDLELIEYLLKKKPRNEYELKNFKKENLDMAFVLCDMIYDNDIDKLIFLKQYLKIFTEEEKEKNHSV